MHRIVLDTNILISSILKKGVPYKILHDVVALRKVQLLISTEIMSEYEAVIAYTRFSKYKEFAANAKDVLDHVKRVAVSHEPDIKLDVVKDSADNKFIELAVSAGADFLITGNTNHFTFSEYEGVTIISPGEYYRQHWSS